MLAEIVENPLPKDRIAHDVHKHPLYYAVRNHIIDFLVTRSRSYDDAAKNELDRRRVPVVRPRRDRARDRGRDNGPALPSASRRGPRLRS